MRIPLCVLGASLVHALPSRPISSPSPAFSLPRSGYTEVVSPNMFNIDLWRISGHAEHYLENMFTFKARAAVVLSLTAVVAVRERSCPLERHSRGRSRHAQRSLHRHAPLFPCPHRTLQVEGQDFGLKPMNCPGHCLMFDNRVRSYRGA